MKKLNFFGMLLSASVILNSCNSKSGNSTDDEKNSPDHVKKHSGKEITPQAKIDSDSTTRLEIDTVSSAKSAEEAGQ